MKQEDSVTRASTGSESHQAASGQRNGLPPLPRFTFADAEAAADSWGANCGPAALAVMTGRTLNEVRRVIPKFEERRYTNPTMMFEALDALGVFRNCRSAEGHGPLDWPRFGLARIQWEGPWMKPGVPIAARYGHTHWVGAMRLSGEVGVFDINCLNNGSGWVSASEWAQIVVPWLLACVEKKASGQWHITHSVELERLAGPTAPDTKEKR